MKYKKCWESLIISNMQMNPTVSYFPIWLNDEEIGDRQTLYAVAGNANYGNLCEK